MLNVALPAILLFVSYFAFRNEIAAYWEGRYAATFVQPNGREEESGRVWDENVLHFKNGWLLNYTLLYGTLLAAFNLRKMQHKLLGAVNAGLLLLGLLGFLTGGLLALSELRDSYLGYQEGGYFKPTAFAIGFRYLSFGFVAAALWVLYRYTCEMFAEPKFKRAFDALLHLYILWLASSELINLLALAGSPENYKLGLSILWGIYALLLIALGIWRRKQYLRFGAMALFGVTLLKLFFYDIAYLGTIAKTVVFVSLGILLLLISFLYNKYKGAISNEPAEE